MVGFSLGFLSLMIFISLTGIIGNVFLILSIIQARFSRMKSFEVFLLGLAAFNLEEIIIVDLYDIAMFQSIISFDTWLCRMLKFLTVLGETASTLFTVLISIFRYQKLKDAERRVSLPIFLDNIRSAWMVSGICAILAILLSAPTYAIKFHGHLENFTDHSVGCPPDFFQCYSNNCPFLNHYYKHLFIVICILLPLFIISVTSCFMIKVLLFHKRIITPVLGVSKSGQSSKKYMGLKLQRSTVAILAAMGVFAVDGAFYLILHLGLSPYNFPQWYQLELCMISSYTTISPYVYGMGNNLNFFKKILKK
ncbi:C5a anaphylatoxin chemotactic receptor 1 [Lampris incognitus]|uniref:C5a anaphylatoxin chemotactic receptor 1 n=1 Tax=Lampris incognitus TaxID=2546036 RepID=UPI0024B4FDEB|nr:C5a anaphylatoxin chemotactic receptor 1 [Lampris incognitus]